MYCQWFDDVYHPESSRWAAIFSPAERRSFEQFSERLRRCEGVIGGKDLWDVLNESCWLEVMDGATQAVRVMRNERQSGEPDSR